MNRLIGWALALAVGLTAVALAPASAQAEGPAVTRVLVVDVAPNDMPQYMALVKRAMDLNKSLGLPGFSVLQATMAGDSTGSLAIIIENDSLAGLAANQSKTQASAEWQALMQEFQQAGISRIVSDSLWVDRTPK